MTTQLYSVLDLNALGEGMRIEQGGMILTTDSINSPYTKTLCTQPKGSGDGYFEVAFWVKSLSALAGRVAVGVAQPDSDLTAPPGDDALSWGYYPGTGEVRHNNVAIDTIDILEERSIIGVYTSVFPGGANMSLVFNGSYVKTYALTAGKFWVPCGMVADDSGASPALGAGDTSMFFNAGLRGFVYPQVTAGL